MERLEAVAGHAHAGDGGGSAADGGAAVIDLDLLECGLAPRRVANSNRLHTANLFGAVPAAAWARCCWRVGPARRAADRARSQRSSQRDTSSKVRKDEKKITRR